AGEARAWESVRAEAEAAVRAIPGVSTAMIALTAERKAGSASAPPPPSAPPPHRHAHAGGVQPAASHKPPQGGQSPMSRQAEIPRVAAILRFAPGKGGGRQAATCDKD